MYNEQRIADFWKGRPGELASRWTRFARIAVPWLTSVANSFLRGNFEQDQRKLARSAVNNLTELGPTFVKLGQILSIRPDVLPPPIMEELGKLQARMFSVYNSAFGSSCQFVVSSACDKSGLAHVGESTVCRPQACVGQGCQCRCLVGSQRVWCKAHQSVF